MPTKAIVSAVMAKDTEKLILHVTNNPVNINAIDKESENQVSALFFNLLWNHCCFLDDIEDIICIAASIIPKYCSGTPISTKMLLLNVPQKIILHRIAK